MKWVHSMLALACALCWAPLAAREPKASASPIVQALALAKKENWREAREKFNEALAQEKDWSAPSARGPVEGSVTCSEKLEDWDAAFQLTHDFIARTRGTFAEIIGLRFLGGLHRRARPWGDQRKTFAPPRADSRSVSQAAYQRYDTQQAIAAYERARNLLIALAAGGDPALSDLIRAERIGVNFDLASAILGSPRDPESWWSERATNLPGKTEVEEETRTARRNRAVDAEVPLNAGGQPIEIVPAEAYDPAHGDGRRVLFLLREIEALDSSKTREDAATALLRRALIARGLYGAEPALRQLESVRWGAEVEPPLRPLEDLGEDEVLLVQKDKLRIVPLPPGENPLLLFREVVRRFPGSEAAREAEIAEGLYFQSRSQFPAATAQFERLLAKRPSAKKAAFLRDALRAMRKPSIALEKPGVHFPGTRPVLRFRSRNLPVVEFRAWRIDYATWYRATLTSREYGLELRAGEAKTWKSHVIGPAIRWREKLPGNPRLLTTQHATTAPFSAPGAYIVETLERGQVSTSTAVFLTDAAVFLKFTRDQTLAFLLDARTGQALANRDVTLFERSRDAKDQVQLRAIPLRTDAEGLATAPRTRAKETSLHLLFGEPGGQFASLEHRDYRDSREEGVPSAFVAHVVTDRPVYRPGDTVRFRLSLRARRGAEFDLPPAGKPLTLVLFGRRNEQTATLSATTDEAGGVTGEFTLPAACRLGRWAIGIGGKESIAGQGEFAVEEYRKPEFEVTVKVPDATPRFGEKFSFTVSARYLFGAPVAQARVRYTVTRSDFPFDASAFEERGWVDAGIRRRADRSYPWLSWTSPGGLSGDPFGGRGTVARAESTLRADGTVEIEIDPAQSEMKPDRVYQYTIEAEVTDASRRTEKAGGGLTVANRSFALSVRPDQSFSESPEPMRVELRAFDLAGKGVATPGEWELLRLEYHGAAQADVREVSVSKSAAATSAEGKAEVRCPFPGAGQYRLRYTARDSTDQLVEANALVWIGGPDFDGRRLRFQDLEIITDRGSYRPGDTARVLLATKHDHARVLFVDDAIDGELRSWRFVNVPARAVVMPLRIGTEHAPTRHLEATLVKDGILHIENEKVQVTRPEAALQVTLATDQPRYSAGGSGTLRITARDAAGNPARGELAVRGWNEALRAFEDRGWSFFETFYHPWSSHAPVRSDSLTRPGGGGYLADPAGVGFGGRANWVGGWAAEAAGYGLSTGTPRDPDGLQRRRVRRFPDGNWSFAGDDAEPQRVIVTGSYIPTADGAGPLPATPTEGLRQLPSAVGNTRTENNSNGGPPEPSGPRPPPPAAAALRSDFSDTALWQPKVRLEPDGTAVVPFQLPDSLTRWRFNGFAISPTTQVGEASTSAVATKQVLVRLQAPRFFIERDEVIVSSIAHNYLDQPQRIRAELTIPRDRLAPLDPAKAGSVEAGEMLTLTAEADIPPLGEHRFDWPLRALTPGTAVVTAKALAPAESDAVRMTFPVLVHGIEKRIAEGGSYRPAQEGTRTLTLTLPAEIDPAQSRLEVSLSPSLAGVLVDALPFLAGYPYGCVEQTMSRFYPTALVAGTLKRLGTDLPTLGKLRQDPRRAQQFGASPVFDPAELARMTEASLDRIKSWQRPDGGWGWWSEDAASAYQTAYVLQGLLAARAAGMELDELILSNGANFLRRCIQRELAVALKKRQLGDTTTQVFLAYVLGLTQAPTPEARKWLAQLHAKRGELSQHGRALLTLALQRAGMKAEAALTLRNLLQFLERDDANETAWIRTPRDGWWHWWQNDIETNAWALRAIIALEPKSDLAPRLVKWLVNNRAGDSHWRSTRDTALAISAIAEYLKVSGEEKADFTATVRIDEHPPQELRFARGGMLGVAQSVVLEGAALKPGKHTITLTKTGRGALYYSASVNFFTQEQDIPSAGGDLAVERSYFKLVPAPAGAAKAEPTRVALAQGDEVRSGEEIEVVLNIQAKNSFDFLAFEDRKPAGCEPVEIRSGGTYADGFCANVELRDTKVVFFVAALAQGEHVLRYRLRAEAPGSFRAPPATGFAMYAPELRANSRTMRIKVGE